MMLLEALAERVGQLKLQVTEQRRYPERVSGAVSTFAESETLMRRIPAESTSLSSLEPGSEAVFNLTAILSMERDITTSWPMSNASVQRSLAPSGSLMMYRTARLAIGVWKQNVCTRWQVLTLLIFTIAKVFLYDIGDVRQGYRVASFLTLGVLPTGVGYAYQKDWVGLKKQKATA